MNDTKLVVAEKDAAKSEMIELSSKELLHHTLVVGQSGSGKSFFIMRLLEELLLKTGSRIVLIDPNGDFRKLDSPSDAVWQNEELFGPLNRAKQKAGYNSFDEKTKFEIAWSKIARKRLRVPNPSSPAWTVDAETLSISWREIERIGHRLLLLDCNLPHFSLGLDACRAEHETRSLQQSVDTGIEGLIDIVDAFADRNIDLSKYSHVKSFTATDWVTVRAKLETMLSRHRLLWAKKGEVANSPTFLLQQEFKKPGAWQCLTIALEHANREDALLAAAVTLNDTMRFATEEWAKALNDPSKDERVPTFLVVDEAHNFAPEFAEAGLQQMVSDAIQKIASEGRKFGLYLVLATQRPSKLNPGLVKECENSAVLRLQAPIEQRFASETLGIKDDYSKKVQEFDTGQVLLHGRWTKGHSVQCRGLPARTTVGGGGLPSNWLTSRIEASLPINEAKNEQG